MQDDANDQVPLWKVFFGKEKSKTTSPDTKTQTTTKTTTTSTTTTTKATTTTTPLTTKKASKPGLGKDDSGGGGSVNKVSALQESSDEGAINSGECQDAKINRPQDLSMRLSEFFACASANIY